MMYSLGPLFTDAGATPALIITGKVAQAGRAIGGEAYIGWGSTDIIE